MYEKRREEVIKEKRLSETISSYQRRHYKIRGYTRREAVIRDEKW